MAKSKPNFDSLNTALPCKTKKKGGKQRRVCSGNRNDAVSDAFAKCSNAADIAHLAMKFGITEQEIRTKAKMAPNFGQFNMTMRNKIRGIVKRIAEAKEKGVRLTMAEAAQGKKATKKAPAKKATKKAKKKSK